MNPQNCFNFLNESSDNIYDIALIGAGPSNLFAGFAAGMNNMKVVFLDALSKVGGQCSALYGDKNIYDIPSRRSITASGLIERLVEQASMFAPDCFLENLVENIEGSVDSFFSIKTNKGNIIKAKRVILGIGNGSIESKKLSLPEAHKCESKSLFYSVLNISDFIRKEISILGGGDSAVDWAIMLSEVASRVHLIHRRDKFSCYPEKEARVRDLASNGKINLLTPYAVSDLTHSDGFIKNISLQNLESNSIKKIYTDYVLAFFGLASNLEYAKKWGVDITSNNKINVDKETFMTSRAGIYAIGDIANNRKRKLILTGFSEAEVACSHIKDAIYPDVRSKFEYSTTKFEDFA